MKVLKNNSLKDNWEDISSPKVFDVTTNEYDKLKMNGSLEKDSFYLINDDISIRVDNSLAYDTTYFSTINKTLYATFNCVYCGTQNFENSQLHTPHCPNCGALMRRAE